MKKFFIAIGFMAYISNAVACDVCGCSAGGGTMGILPRFNRHFVGIKYNYSAFRSEHLKLFENETPLHSNEYFSTATLWGRYVAHKRLQFFAFLPYNYFVRNEENVKTVSQGWGDFTVMGSYIVLNTTDSAKHRWRHALQAGAGIKLPTGANNRQQNGTMLNSNLQPGTGSYDFPVNVQYTLRYKKRVGLNTELNYTISNSNSRGYEFGNRLASAARLFYWKNYKNITVLPQAGINFEHREQDWNGQEYLSYTGGNTVAVTAAVDIYFQKIAVGVGLKRPVSQNMGGGNIIQQTACTASIVYLF